MKRTVVLLILDGWGVGRNDITNAIYAAAPANFTELSRRYPSGALLSHGIAVGLPWESPGTGEAGHLTIGAGRTVYQPAVKITLAIRNTSFFENNTLITAMRSAAKAKGAVHLIGTLSEKNTHSSLEHLHALIALATQEKIPRVRVHALVGSKDSGPRAATTLIKKVPWNETTKLASLAGRYYATNETKDIIALAKNAILGIGAKTDDIEKYLHDFYLHGIGDEFIEPATIGPDPRGIEENDTVIFFDFDGYPLKKLTELIARESESPKNISVVTLTNYDMGELIPMAFMDDHPTITLGGVLSAHKKTQFRIAETDRYPHVTYFMNGLSNESFVSEYRILIPTEQIARKEERPEMMMHEVASRGIAAIEEGADFVVMNFTAPDAMAHTGNFEATKQAVRAADRELGNITKAVLARGGALIVTSDHGNAEQMRNPVTGVPETGHNANPVPVIVIAKELEKPNNSIVPSYETTVGILTDIAPTILALMDITKPEEMTGSSLIGKLT